MTQKIQGMAARFLMGAALVLGSASVFAAVQPAFSQEGGHDSGTTGESTAKSHTDASHTSHTSGESQESTTEHSGGSCRGGACAGGSHDSGSTHESGESHESGGKKGGANKGGRRGGAGDYSHTGGKAGGVEGHVFDQPEEGHESDANRGPHPGGNPAEKSDETHDHETGGDDPH